MLIVHYVPDCPNETGNDTLAVTNSEAMALVNCSDCLFEMKEQGFFDEEEPWPDH